MQFGDKNLNPFEVIFYKADGNWHVKVQKGSVHGYYKPETRLDVTGAIEDISKGGGETYILNEETKFLYVQVGLLMETIKEAVYIRYPGSAKIKVGTELPENEVDDREESGAEMSVGYYMVCEIQDGVLKQGICSDIWVGAYVIDHESSSSSSVSSSSSSSSQSGSSSSSSSSASSIPNDSSSSSSSDSINSSLPIDSSAYDSSSIV